MRNPIWTLEDIHNLPLFGDDVGWFYGLVKHYETGRVWIYEIFPGCGFAVALDRYTFYKPRVWKMIIKDIWQATKR